MKKDINRIKISRIFIQIIFFVFFTELFSLVFSSMKSIYLGAMNGNLETVNIVTSLVPIVTIVFLVLVLGRFFCGWLCAFGALNDFIFNISKRVFRLDFKVNEKLDSVLKYLKYVILALIIILGWTKSEPLIDMYNPWNAFAELRMLPQVLKHHPMQFGILAFIILGAALIERFFCRYLCPLGAVQALISKGRFSWLIRDNNTCGKCNLCTKNCSMGINISKLKKVKSGECIGCLKCVGNCPKGNFKISILKQKIKPMTYVLIGLILFLSIYSSKYILEKTLAVSDMQLQTKQELQIKVSAKEENDYKSTDKEKIYKDGVYTGVSVGKRPEITVKVTIERDKIMSIEIVSHKESMEYCQRPFKVIPKEIISSQSVEVDAVSGATNTSTRLIKAVENAVEKAKKDNVS
ncbi:4Fe-4S binding protein [Clostridium sp. ZS2-4]|uniref:4Fe-4S binding protein n=1 Tax=Clostridium sp. ZS2-4 TaxID=2987703 RepID=UPI00227B4FF2|nr:4Fe-4S binding protein [Clostridium sp. ZS2-4]MCY6354896.1 4Fe-4S binding protein [Clostridium sp. ZS2-4]